MHGFSSLLVGNHALKPDEFTPAMQDAITTIMSDPEESWYVIDGALQALHHAPVELIKVNIPAILPWTTNEDWWLRESAFMALMGLRDDEQSFVENLPIMIDVMIREGHYNPRVQMLKQLRSALAKWKNDSAPGKLIVAGFAKATMDTEVLPDVGEVRRWLEGTSNIVEVALASIAVAPEASANLAEAIAAGRHVGHSGYPESHANGQGARWHCERSFHRVAPCACNAPTRTETETRARSFRCLPAGVDQALQLDQGSWRWHPDRHDH